MKIRSDALRSFVSATAGQKFPSHFKMFFLRPLVVAGLLTGWALSGSAQTLAWTGSGSVAVPSDGPWDTTTPNLWNDGNGTVGDSSWITSDNAVFGGADGTYAITVGASFSANTLTFTNSGYSLAASGAQTITLTSTAGSTIPQIQFTAGTTNNLGANVTLQASSTGLYLGTHGATPGGTLNLNSGATVKQNSSNSGGLDGNGTVVNINVGAVFSGPNNGGSSGSWTIAPNADGAVTVDVEGGNLTFGTGKQPLNVGGGGAGTLTVDSGMVSLNAGAANGIDMGNGAGGGTINLNGGTILTPVVKRGAGTATFNFNGGTLQANANNVGFVTGLTVANVRNGGAVVNDGGFAITIGQALAHSAVGGDNATDGGLTKSGAGTLILSGANSYNGPTTVNTGTLIVTTASTGGGDYVVANGTTLNLQVAGAGASLTNNSLTLGSGGNVTNIFTLGANASQTAPAIMVNGALNLNSTVIVNVSGTITTAGIYPLIAYGSLSGSGSFAPGIALPSITGYSVTLTNDTVNKMLEIAYTAVTGNAQWSVGNGTWDTTSLNWEPIGGGSAITYAENELVAFNDAASGSSPITITLAGNHSPGGITNNSTKNYILTDGGAGYSLTGNGGLIKAGSSTLTLALNAAYTGNTTLSGGTLALTNSAAIPNSPIIAVMTNTVLDVSRTSSGALTLNNGQTLIGSGTVNGGLNVASGATINPGDTIGTLTIQSNVSLGGTLLLEINRTNLQNSDELVLANWGNNSGAMMTLVNQGPPLQVGDTFKVISKPTSFGLNSGLPLNLPALPAGLQWLVNLGSEGTLSVGGSGNLLWTGGGTTNAPGSGNWDATTPNMWSDGTNAAGDATWTNGATAIFGGTDGNYAINLGTNLSVSNLVFQVSGYTLSAASPTVIPLGPSGSPTAPTSGSPAFTWGSATEFITNTIGTNVSVLANSTCYAGAPAQSVTSGTLIIANGGKFASGNSGTSLELNGGNMFISVQSGGMFGFNDNSAGSGSLQIGNQPSATITVDVDGGAVAIPGSNEKLVVGATGFGTLNVNGGAVNVAANSAQGIQVAGAVTSEGVINLNGGILSAPFIVKANSLGYALFYFNGGTLKATENQGAFLNALDQIAIRTNSAIIDSSGFNVEIDLPLVHTDEDPDLVTDGGLTKMGAGTLTLGGGNSYNGGTLVSNGTLALTGGGSFSGSAGISIASGATWDVSAVSPYDVNSSQTLAGSGAVNGSVQVDGMIAPGFSGVGTLTFNNNLTINGNLVFKLNKFLAESNDLVVVDGTLNNTGSGMLTITNLGPGLAVGDKFTLFSQPLPNGNNLTLVPPPGVTFTNNLSVDGSIQVLTAPNTIASDPTNITASVSGNTLDLTWPQDHLGWIAQSNSLGLANSGAWFDIPNSQNGTNLMITINQGMTNVFYRLRYP
jgi:autotransporter-associated beta strand protein